MSKTSTKWITKQPIDMAYMLSIYTFVKTNGEISSCLAKKHNEIFKSEWFIAWFKEGREILRPSMFGSEDLKRAIEKFLIEMSDMLLMFGFAGYYYVKDMVGWAEHNVDDYFKKLPFGVIPLRASGSGTLYGTYTRQTNLYTMEESVIFECTEPHLTRLYEFEVFQSHADFVSLTDGVSTVSNIFASTQINRACTNDVVPVSPFTSLYIEKSLTEEANTNRHDANWYASHPVTYVRTIPAKDAKVDTISESVMYSSDTFSNAKQSDLMKKQSFALQRGRYLVDKLNQPKSGSAKPENMIRNIRLEKNKRPDNTEGMHVLPEFMEVQAPHVASSLIDVDVLQKNYEQNVCSVVRFPHIFFKDDGGVSSSTSTGRSVSEDQLNFQRIKLYEEIESEHNTMSRVFGLLYSLTYYNMDVMTMGSYYDLLHQEDDGDDTEKKKKKNKKKKNNDDDQEIINYIKMAQNKLSTIKVEVSFEKVLTRTSASLLPLVQFLDKGVIDEAYVRKHVYLVYGNKDELK